MPVYSKLLNRAINDYSHQPAREAKIRAIRREFKARRETEVNLEELPTGEELLAQCLALTGCSFSDPIIVGTSLHVYGRKMCEDMLNKSVPFVVAYDPKLDLNWPF